MEKHKNCCMPSITKKIGLFSLYYIINNKYLYENDHIDYFISQTWIRLPLYYTTNPPTQF